ncbi:MAG: hypothetical protein HY906_02970, partial [Deltaproteobacteria bacterium]|nr:hypothetical protein [Deltaproteobacteria bacterium]
MRRAFGFVLASVLAGLLATGCGGSESGDGGDGGADGAGDTASAGDTANTGDTATTGDAPAGDA